MKRELRFQLKSAFYSKNFLIILTISILFSVICFMIKCFECYEADIINIPSAYQQFFANARSNDSFVAFFSIASPFLICAAFSDSYVTESNNLFLPICIIREGKNKYFFSKLTAVFICGAFVMVIPQLINIILCTVAFPLESTYMYTWDLWQADIYTVDIANDWFLFKNLYILSPYIYFLVFIAISGILSGITAVISFEISFFVKNRIFVTSFMFVLINLLSVLFESYMIPYNIINCMFGLSVSGITLKSFIITSVTYLSVMIILIPFSLRRLKNCL
ncbi:MAG: hypothetical protein LIO62_03180 [Clostridiales bacterium]|nr:hypothetical protein [Clostridiales bacterium]